MEHVSELDGIPEQPVVRGRASPVSTAEILWGFWLLFVITSIAVSMLVGAGSLLWMAIFGC